MLLQLVDLDMSSSRSDSTSETSSSHDICLRGRRRFAKAKLRSYIHSVLAIVQVGKTMKDLSTSTQYGSRRAEMSPRRGLMLMGTDVSWEGLGSRRAAIRVG